MLIYSSFLFCPDIAGNLGKGVFKFFAFQFEFPHFPSALRHGGKNNTAHIIVGVALDTLQQIESHLLMRHYDGFMKSGKIKGRIGR